MFLYAQWRGLSLVTRAVLAKEFGFSKVGPTHVVDNRIESDGYKLDDVERSLNIDAIQKYTGVESTDMQVLWNAMIDKAEGRDFSVKESFINTENISPGIKLVEIEKGTEVSVPKKRGRKPKIK